MSQPLLKHCCDEIPPLSVHCNDPRCMRGRGGLGLTAEQVAGPRAPPICKGKKGILYSPTKRPSTSDNSKRLPYSPTLEASPGAPAMGRGYGRGRTHLTGKLEAKLACCRHHACRHPEPAPASCCHLPAHATQSQQRFVLRGIIACGGSGMAADSIGTAVEHSSHTMASQAPSI